MDMKTDIVENMTTDDTSESHSQEMDMSMVENEAGDHTSQPGPY